MIFSVWRYSHLFLALSSALFLLVAAITGIVLSFSPINNKLSSNYQPEASTIYLATFLDSLSSNFSEVIEIKKDNKEFFQVSAINFNGDLETFYVDLLSGKKIGSIQKESKWFSLSRDIHRSLLLKKTGRILIGVVSFFLFLIAFSGCFLIAKRQLSIKRFYSKVVFDDFYRFWHLMVGRYSLFFVVIIAITGTYLSLERFELLPSSSSNHDFNENQLIDYPKMEWNSFSIFKSTLMSDVESLQFPFSPFVEDYFTLILKDEELLVNQFNGDIISRFDFGTISKISRWSYNLHTGKGSILWSLLLCFTCFCILFFIFSGFSIFLSRVKSKRSNKFSKNQSSILILVGTENGSTNRFAGQFYDSLIQSGHSAFIDQMNNYKPIKGLSHLLIFTSTYGSGEAPSSAVRFFKKFKKNPLSNPFQFSVVGFGSSFYPEFCKYAIDVQAFLESFSLSSCAHPIQLIDNQSEDQYSGWFKSWVVKNKLTVDFNLKKKNENSIFSVVNNPNQNNHPEGHFLLYLQPVENAIEFCSGDLLAITPPNSTYERMYSIASLYQRNTILLTVKKQSNGLCSNFLSGLKSGDLLNARIVRNTKFHVPVNFQKLLFISNGTGIAPFIGMATENKHSKSITFLWGGRTESSFSLYKPLVEPLLEHQKIASFSIAFSNDANHPSEHVQDLLIQQKALIQKHLASDSAIMICGAKQMGEDVLKIIEDSLTEFTEQSIDYFIDSGKIKVDTY